jgi:tryptophan synthase alpha chain
MSSSPADATGRRLARAFTSGHPALITYLMAGYPDRAASLTALNAVADAGADLIELGVPYTDQLADGPVIVKASAAARAAAAGRFGLAETLDLAREFVAGRVDAPPIALMCYLNPLMKYGYERAAAEMAAAGIGGVIVPDLPPDMAGDWLAASRDLLDTVFLAAPTSTPERLTKVGELSSGFVYCVSTTGITGERSDLPPALTDTVERVRAAVPLPVAVGFGISTPEQAAAVAGIADGIVVGSAVVRRQGDVATLGTFVSDLARAVHTR